MAVTILRSDRLYRCQIYTYSLTLISIGTDCAWLGIWEHFVHLYFFLVLQMQHHMPLYFCRYWRAFFSPSYLFNQSVDAGVRLVFECCISRSAAVIITTSVCPLAIGFLHFCSIDNIALLYLLHPFPHEFVALMWLGAPKNTVSGDCFCVVLVGTRQKPCLCRPLMFEVLYFALSCFVHLIKKNCLADVSCVRF